MTPRLVHTFGGPAPAISEFHDFAPHLIPGGAVASPDRPTIHAGKNTAPKAFLFATARNRAVDVVRTHVANRTEALAEIDSLNVLDDADGIPEAVARNQELELLTQAIQSLPERCRQVLTLRRLYGLSQKEVAARLNISENIVEHQVTIGVRKCTEFLARYWKK